MDKAAKERLIGAVVLFAAAWLLLPVFLDGPGEGDPTGDVRELRLPQQGEQDPAQATMKRQTVVLDAAGEPAPPIQSLQPEASSGGATGATAAADAPPQSAARDDAAADPGAGGATPAGPQTEPADDDSATEAGAVASQPAPRTEPEPEPEPEAETAREPAPASTAGPADAADDAQLWAVQLGSFSDKDNADRLAAELRGAGYPAFLSQVSTGGRTLHRVRVGPQADRGASEAMQARLAAAGYAGSPVRHP